MNLNGEPMRSPDRINSMTAELPESTTFLDPHNEGMLPI
jgi:hypothetical protein